MVGERALAFGNAGGFIAGGYIGGRMRGAMWSGGEGCGADARAAQYMGDTYLK